MRFKTGEIERRIKEEFDDSDDWIKKLSFEMEGIAANQLFTSRSI
jgi:hypothetical protein